MEQKEFESALRSMVEEHLPSDIPDELNWEALSPELYTNMAIAKAAGVSAASSGSAISSVPAASSITVASSTISTTLTSSIIAVIPKLGLIALGVGAVISFGILSIGIDAYQTQRSPHHYSQALPIQKLESIPIELNSASVELTISLSYPLALSNSIYQSSYKGNKNEGVEISQLSNNSFSSLISPNSWVPSSAVIDNRSNHIKVSNAQSSILHKLPLFPLDKKLKQTLAPKEIHALPFFPFPQSELLLKLPHSTSRIPVPVFSKSTLSKWELMIYSGFNKWSENYSHGPSEEDIRLTNTSPLYGWQGGMRIMRGVRKNWEIISGISYESLRSKTELDDREVALLFRPNTLDSVIIDRVSGDSTLIFTDSVLGERRRVIRNVNQFTSIQLPVLIGYKLPIPKNFELILQSGISVAWRRKNTGISVIQNPELNVMENAELFDTNFTLGVQGAIQFRYPLGTHWSLTSFIEGNQQITNGINAESSPLTLNRFTYGVNIGVVRKL